MDIDDYDSAKKEQKFTSMCQFKASQYGNIPSIAHYGPCYSMRVAGKVA